MNKPATNEKEHPYSDVKSNSQIANHGELNVKILIIQIIYIYTVKKIISKVF